MNTSTPHQLAVLLSCLLIAASAAVAQSNSGLSVSKSNHQATVIYHGKQVWAGPAKGTPVGLISNLDGVDRAAAFDGDTVLWENAAGVAAQLKAAPVPPGVPEAQPLLEEHRRAVEAQRRLVEEQIKNIQNRAGGGNGGVIIARGGGGISISSTFTANNGQVGGNTMMSVGPDTTVKRIDGATTLSRNGQTVDLGRTTGPLSLKSVMENGVETITLLEAGKSLWNSASGPAQAREEAGPLIPGGLLLRDGTMMEAEILNADDTLVVFRKPGGAEETLPTSRLAAAILQPLPEKRRTELNRAASGLLLRSGEFLEGDCRDFKKDEITISSVLFGLKKFDTKRDARALVFHPVDPAGRK